ncbi:MAG: UDP-N-acetylglucosamine 1-carboxyvinyltransferase [Pseudomonadota bacterium]
MKTLIVHGAQPLGGTVEPAGNKNAALPLLTAGLLADAGLMLCNVPEILDTARQIELLRAVGARVEQQGGSVSVSAGELRPFAPSAACAAVRTAPLLAAPLLVRTGRASIGRPGGDRIGRRRLDTHFLALRALGARVDVVGDRYELSTRGLRGADIFLDEASVTGTAQAILAAVLADGTSVIDNAAAEPHIQSLCLALNAMGADISGAGSHRLEIRGVASLGAARVRIPPDHIEVGSWIALAAATGARLRILRAQPDQQRITSAVFARLGVSVCVAGQDLIVPGAQRLDARCDIDGAEAKIDDLPWPGFPADLISVAVALATRARGRTLVHQRLFDARLGFVRELRRMGARIDTLDAHRVRVHGGARLRGARVRAPDIRAGMALLIAALCADGETRIEGAEQLERGYARLLPRLRELGAQVSVTATDPRAARRIWVPPGRGLLNTLLRSGA